MIKRIRDIAIIVSVLVVAAAYAYTTLATGVRTDDYHKRLENARMECIKEGANASFEEDYRTCMRYRGLEP